MLVKELIEILAKQNPDAMICLDVSCENGQCGGCAMDSIEVETYYSESLKSDVVCLNGEDEY